jgi:hypothetical protein
VLLRRVASPTAQPDAKPVSQAASARESDGDRPLPVQGAVVIASEDVTLSLSLGQRQIEL